MCVHLQPASLETTVFWICLNQSFVALPIPDFIVRTTYPELENMGGNSFAYTDTGRISCEIPSVVRLDLSLNIINYIRMHWNSLEIGWKNSGQLLEFLDRCISVFCYIWLQLIEVFWQVQSQEFSQWSPTHLERKSI